MDLTTFAIILIVLLVSFLSMVFISRFPKGKTFDEMVKEKREMREKLLGLTSAAASGKSTAGKETAGKKTKKPNQGANQQKQQQRAGKQQQQQPPQRVEVVEKDEDGNSSESSLDEEINMLTFGAKKRVGLGTNLTVEYAETEPFALNENAAGAKKRENKQQQQQHGGKKNKQKSAGILLNKAEPVLVKQQQESDQEVNHFEEIHPKDALEIARQQKHEDELKAPKQQPPKEQRHGKGKKEGGGGGGHHGKMSPKNQSADVEQHHHHVEGPTEVKVAAVAVQKKKNTDLLMAGGQLGDATIADITNVHSLVNILNRTELPRNDIQILIDFLLNKQQDTLAKDPSEWNDPSDPLQKLKKQLQEKEAALLEEQQAAVGLQCKLKELRLELNGEKMQSGALVKGYIEELHGKKQEVQHLHMELQSLKDKMAAEKQGLSMQFQQLQAKYIQLSKEHAAVQDHGTTTAQLSNDLQLLQQELMAKSQLLNEKLQSEEVS